jgi:hypothetical protein
MLRRVVSVRAVLFIVCVSFWVACAGPMRPAVIPKLSELPADPEKRNAVLDSAHAQPGPENRPVSKKARKAETAAATAAAVIGVLLSKSANVTLGVAAPVDENLLFEDVPKRKDKRAAKDGEGDRDGDKDAPAEPPVESGTLVPWVRLDAEPAHER